MALSEARKKANEKYNAKAYDQVKVLVKKGEREQLKTHAERQGESLNGFINRAIKETIERDNKDGDTE